VLQEEGAVLFQKHEKQKIIQDLLNLLNPTQQEKTRNREIVSQVKVKAKEKIKNSSPQWSRHFVGRISRSCGQD